ncbi:hypothetical protein Y1Q_0000034 [Alligator mississippiensis]|uniref:Uncharacterized protein n=1 Tax=Alligator mississippiensis TaxID=8496 RepID=A0A151NTK6_ALLMI|nr:hypothetical protein Y1Q_0000034 [Alligator mississippiensis]
MKVPDRLDLALYFAHPDVVPNRRFNCQSEKLNKDILCWNETTVKLPQYYTSGQPYKALRPSNNLQGSGGTPFV